MPLAETAYYKGLLTGTYLLAFLLTYLLLHCKKIMTMLILSDATPMAQAAVSSRLASTSYLCQPCRLHWLNRPHFDAVNELITAWNDLHVCLPAGKTLMWLTGRITAWQEKAHHELTVSGDQPTKGKNTGWPVLLSCAFL